MPPWGCYPQGWTTKVICWACANPRSEYTPFQATMGLQSDNHRFLGHLRWDGNLNLRCLFDLLRTVLPVGLLHLMCESSVLDSHTWFSLQVCRKQQQVSMRCVVYMHGCKEIGLHVAETKKSGTWVACICVAPPSGWPAHPC